MFNKRMWSAYLLHRYVTLKDLYFPIHRIGYTLETKTYFKIIDTRVRAVQSDFFFFNITRYVC